MFIVDLEPLELVTLQKVSSSMLKLARDNSLWRSKCFDKSPCAATSAKETPASLALAGLIRQVEPEGTVDNVNKGLSRTTVNRDLEHRDSITGRARAIASWDRTDDLERIDWYSEYIARHANLTASWLDERLSPPSEVRGLAVSRDSTKALGPLENGGLCIWDIGQTATGRLAGHRAFHELSRSPPAVLFQDRTRLAESSKFKAPLRFSGGGECIAIDSTQNKAFVAVADILNEVDLETLRVVSQNKYAWPITALSQDDSADRPLTVGTNWSLHLHDPRVNFRERSQSPEDVAKVASSNPEDSIAFLPNYTKGVGKGFDARTALGAESLTSGTSMFRPSHFGRSPFSNISSGPPVRARSIPRRISRRSALEDYAQCEPGPLSIVHQGENNIFMAGRFPSILSYDRRYFPRLQYVIHSGARLSALATIPYAPCRATSKTGVEATLLACGEYNGRGSLEMYSLPHVKHNSIQSLPTNPEQVETFPIEPADGVSPEAERALSESMELVDLAEPFNYKNRQAASPSKLLSVAAHGTRVVFSDADGGLKWVERDGYGLVRRWNVNNFEMRGNTAESYGEQVVRKIIPINPVASKQGARGDGDLIVWTGEKVGVITTQRPHNDEEFGELSKAFGESSVGNENDGDDEEDLDIQAEEYARMMRRALERQADERRWMSRFNMRYR